MPQTELRNDDQKESDDKKKWRSSLWFWFALYGVSVLTGLSIASCYFHTGADRAKFLVEGLLSAGVLAVVIFQTVIYIAQRDAMAEALNIERAKLTPRLRITNVRVENFEAEREPVFIVSIMNEGATDAKDVALDIRVNLSEEGRIAVKWSNPQIVTISAGQEQHYFVPWRSPQTQERIDAFNTSVPIKVSGRFKLGDTEKKFCYRYYPWKGQRPEGVSQFVPCDFDTRLTHIVKPEGIEVKATVGTVGLVIHKAAPAEAKPESNEDKRRPE